jgi:hypothetical protein
LTRPVIQTVFSQVDRVVATGLLTDPETNQQTKVTTLSSPTSAGPPVFLLAPPLSATTPAFEKSNPISDYKQVEEDDDMVHPMDGHDSLSGNVNDHIGSHAQTDNHHIPNNNTNGDVDHEDELVNKTNTLGINDHDDRDVQHHPNGEYDETPQYEDRDYVGSGENNNSGFESNQREEVYDNQYEQRPR